jgi:hypothetical protein
MMVIVAGPWFVLETTGSAARLIPNRSPCSLNAIQRLPELQAP